MQTNSARIPRAVAREKVFDLDWLDALEDRLPGAVDVGLAYSERWPQLPPEVVHTERVMVQLPLPRRGTAEAALQPITFSFTKPAPAESDLRELEFRAWLTAAERDSHAILLTFDIERTV